MLGCAAVDAWTRRDLLARAGALAVAPSLAAAAARAAAPAPDVPVRRRSAADRRAVPRARRPDHASGSTTPGSGTAAPTARARCGVGVIYNAALLTVHAVAAEAGHKGRARNDARARLLVDRLCARRRSSSARGARAGKMFHSPGWVGEPGRVRLDAGQVDRPEGRRGPARAAWRARDVLGARRRDGGAARGLHRPRRARPLLPLPERAAEPDQLARRAVRPRGARHRHPELLRGDYRAQLRRFVPASGGRCATTGRRTSAEPTGSTTCPHFPGDDPLEPRLAPSTRTSRCTSLPAYDDGAGRRDGAAARAPTCGSCAPGSSARCSATGCTTGMLSWDTGLGVARWMKAKTWAYAQQGLLTIARAGPSTTTRATAPWAKHLFDRGARAVRGDARRRRHARLSRRRTCTASTVAHQTHRRRARVLGADGGERRARGDRRARPDAGARAAAVLRVRRGRRAARGQHAALRDRVVTQNRGAFPYGGVELARLFDCRGPAGRRPRRARPAAFGIVVRGGGRRLATQTPPPRPAARSRCRAPGGARATAARHPDAGPVHRARGRLDDDRARRDGRHPPSLHAPSTIEIDVDDPAPARPRRDAASKRCSRAPDATPSSTPSCEDGRRLRLAPGRPAVRLERVARFELGTPDARYAVRLDRGAGRHGARGPRRAPGDRAARRPVPDRAPSAPDGLHTGRSCAARLQPRDGVALQFREKIAPMEGGPDFSVTRRRAGDGRRRRARRARSTSPRSTTSRPRSTPPAEAKLVVLDLRDVTFIDSAGVRLVLEGDARAAPTAARSWSRGGQRGAAGVRPRRPRRAGADRRRAAGRVMAGRASAAGGAGRGGGAAAALAARARAAAAGRPQRFALIRGAALIADSARDDPRGDRARARRCCRRRSPTRARSTSATASRARRRRATMVVPLRSRGRDDRHDAR